MNGAVAKRLLAVLIGVLVMAMAVAPASYAGEDGDSNNTPRTWSSSSSSGGGGSDTGSASGGVAAGAGGLSVAQSQDMIVPELLAGAGVLVLTTAAGIAFRRRGELNIGGIGR
jgi:hypothetical protein